MFIANDRIEESNNETTDTASRSRSKNSYSETSHGREQPDLAKQRARHQGSISRTVPTTTSSRSTTTRSSSPTRTGSTLYVAAAATNTLDSAATRIDYVEKGFKIYENSTTNTNLNFDTNNVVTFFSDDDIDFNGSSGCTGRLLVDGVLVRRGR